MSWRAEAEAVLRETGARPDAEIDLAEAALALALLARPAAVDPQPYRAHLAALARAAGAALPATATRPLDARTAALAEALAVRHGYAGDRETYDDLRNADLISVIERRRGLPVALGILYLHAARAQGWPAHGLNFPGHFLIRLEAGAEAAILDPFAGGRRLEAADLRALVRELAGAEAELVPAHHAAADNRAILLRLQNNIKVRLLRAGRAGEALAVVERMLLLAPAMWELHREAGLLQAGLGNLRAAIAAFERVAGSAAEPPLRAEAEALLGQLRARLN